jgi:hypothetical protein
VREAKGISRMFNERLKMVSVQIPDWTRDMGKYINQSERVSD